MSVNSHSSCCVAFIHNKTFQSISIQWYYLILDGGGGTHNSVTQGNQKLR